MTQTQKKKGKAAAVKTAQVKKKARRTPPEARIVGEAHVDMSEVPKDEVLPEQPTSVDMVKCRYCGVEMPKPADSTFYACGCADTGVLVTNAFGYVVR